MSKSQAAFLFGSGISIPSGMPSVYELTEAVFHEDWHVYTDGSFFPGANTNQYLPDTITPVVRSFLAKLMEYAADYVAELARPTAGRKPHYEDLYSLAEQAMRTEKDHSPNLASVEFARRLRRDTASLHCGFKGGSGIQPGFSGLVEAACDFLHWVVHHKLHSPGRKRRGLKLISEIASRIEVMDIFTLNHDLLVEQQLEADGFLGINSGFNDDSHGEFLVYQPGWCSDPRRENDKIRLFKMHGSLNWWLYEFPVWNNAFRRVRQYAIPRGYPDASHSKDQDEHFLHPVEVKASFLSGTIVKERHYGLGLWDELFSGFRSHLSRHTHLICCGYGFGDMGINQRLVQWMRDALDGSHRLVILTPDNPTQYFSDKPYWLLQFNEERRIIIVPNYLENCTLSELNPYFDQLS